jgi:2-hydroxy-6-oxonona-2,4-dienedioate hydrolase
MPSHPGAFRPVGLAARRDRVDGLAIVSRYSAAPLGAATPIILVHGLVISSAFLRPAIRLLGRRWRTYAPDLPGYGLSMKPPRTLSIDEQASYLARWMETIGVRRAIVGGVSLGTQFATALASARPDLVAALVLASPTMDPRYRDRARSVWRWLLEAPSELPMAPIALRDFARAGVRRTLATLDLALADRIEDRLPRLGMPALVIHASKDRLVTREWAAEVAGLLPAGRLAVAEGAAHALNFSSPQVFANLVAQFADSLEQDVRAA